jgi:hypothetical protein
MKPLVLMVSLATFGIALSSDLPTASATRMNGKCCMSSDRGLSHRYWMALRRANAIPHTCSAYVAYCIRYSSWQVDGLQMCLAAKAQCLRTGVHVGPYSARRCAGMQKI